MSAYWLFDNAFIRITINNPLNGTYTYKLVNQSNGKITEVSTNNSLIKIRARRGNYALFIEQANRSYFAIIKTEVFLRTSQVNAELVKEKGRQFIGDNPAGCMSLLNNTLISYTCTDLFGNLNIHRPATNNQPTFTIKIPNSSHINGFVQNIINSSLGNLALINEPADSDSDGGYYVVELGSDLTVLSQQKISGLATNITYSIAAYKNGYLIYSPAVNIVYFYKTLGSTPMAINLNGTVDNGMALNSFTISNNLILRVFSSSNDSKVQKSEIIINDGATSKVYRFNSIVSSATLCGLQSICIINNSGLSVYDISSNKPKLLFKVPGSAALLSLGKDTLIATSYGILNLNVASLNGFLEYSYGGYRFNSLQVAGSNYVLSVTNPLGKKVALLINRGTDDTDSIDKKILKLEQLPEISALSIFGKYIYISPALGNLVYDSSLRAYNYDPAVKAVVNSTINQSINNLGIDRSVYTIINTSI